MERMKLTLAFSTPAYLVYPSEVQKARQDSMVIFVGVIWTAAVSVRDGMESLKG